MSQITVPFHLGANRFINRACLRYPAERAANHTKNIYLSVVAKNVAMIVTRS